MNISQQLFLVFFAIFWGTAANAWPKRRPFHWPFVFHSRRVAARVTWSVLALNVVPVVYFGWVLMKLERALAHSGVTACDVIAGVVPAFAMFGFYRIWIAVIECNRSWFYYQDKAEQAQKKPYLECVDPTFEELHPRGGHTPTARTLPHFCNKNSSRLAGWSSKLFPPIGGHSLATFARAAHHALWPDPAHSERSRGRGWAPYKSE